MASEGLKRALAQMWVWLVMAGLLIAASPSLADARPTHRPATKARDRVARRHASARRGNPLRVGRAAPDGVVGVVQTDPALSQLLAPQPSLALSPVQPQGVPVIGVNEQLRYQQFAGLGAALTDSSAWLMFNQISPVTRLALLQSLFGPAGLHLNFLRVPMAASDFTVSAQPYSYDDLPSGQSDPSLANFSIAHDLAYIIPTLRQVLAVNPGLELLANPWSPPAWMKANDSLGNTGGQGTRCCRRRTPRW